MMAVGLVLFVVGYVLQELFPPSRFYYSWRDWGYYAAVAGAALILGSVVTLAWKYLP